MQPPPTNLITLVSIVIFGVLRHGTAQEKGSESVSSEPRVITVEMGKQIYELEQVLSPPFAGTFYSLARPGFPPSPASTIGCDVFYFGDAFLVDDRHLDFSSKTSGDNFSMMSGPSPPGEGGGGESDPIDLPPAYFYDPTNLWIQVEAVTNGSALFTIYTPETNGTFDLFTTTNLTATVPGLNLTNWLWLLRTDVGQTNIIMTNLWPSEGWFRLGTMLDSDGDMLTDAMELLSVHSDPQNPDSDSDGISDYWELQLGTNPTFNESSSSSSRLSYSYAANGRLETVSGAKSDSFLLDGEGNVQQTP